MINVGIIGCGMSAKTFHLPLIASNPQFAISAVVSSKTQLDLSRFPHAKQYYTVDEMLNQAQIDLVVNTAPNTVHFSLTKQCLEARKHVVLEKPMTITLQEAQQLLEIAEQNNVLLSVFHNRRLDGDFLTIKKLLSENKLGQIRLFRSNWDRFRPQVRDRWRENAGPGSGFWYDLGPHLIDQAVNLFGLPEAISANIRVLRPGGESDDYAHVLMHYAELEVILNISPYACAPIVRFSVEGEHANYVKYGLDPQESQLKEGLTPEDENFGIEPTSANGKIWYPDGKCESVPTLQGQFGDYYANLAAAILQQAPLAVQPRQAIDVMAILLMACESAKKGRVLPFDKNDYSNH